MVENSGKSLISAPQVQLSAIQVEQAAQQEAHSSVVLGKPKVQSLHRMYWIKKKNWPRHWPRHPNLVTLPPD